MTPHHTAPSTDDDPICNPSANPTLAEVAQLGASRRAVMAGGLGAALGAFLGGGTRPATAAPDALIGFQPVPIAREDRVVVPPGYTARVVVPWGTPITGAMPAWRPDNSAAEQAMQIGMHHDGMAFFPIDGSSADGLLVVNHEYIEPRLLIAAAAGRPIGTDRMPVTGGKRPAEEVRKEINAHGVSVVRIRRGANGAWDVVADARNRRITAATPMRMVGPAAGHALLRTAYSPDGRAARGTLNNCANGVTPWGTYLTCEENWAEYFRNTDKVDGKPRLPREQARYGVSTGEARYNWDQADEASDAFARFDASATGPDATKDFRNEPNGFGWVVEIDPADPTSVPVKHTAMGRFAHEGVVFAPVREGQKVVTYAGDDSRFEYIYKFVSARPYARATAGSALLDEGTLYVARFNADGTGEWLPLVQGQGPLTAAAGFADQGEVLVNTRLAADAVGATKMDRPEWGAVDPRDGRVYFTLTNNARRTEAQAGGPNPRAANQFGQIVRWREEGDDHAATRFAWDLFVLAGPEGNSRTATGGALGADNMLACPDGLWFDPDGRLWIQTDIGEAEQWRGVLAPFGNNAMLCANPVTGEIRRFLTGPIGQEITGIAMTPDQRTMFVNVQHPGATTTPEDFAAGRMASRWPDGTGLPRSATVVITRDDGGIIGT
jgi:secreted PhoX family phosphatase